MLNNISPFFVYNWLKPVTYLILLTWFSLFNNVMAEENTHKRNILGPKLQKGVLLVADNNLVDPNFERTIVLITDFNSQGTIGIVLNRRTKYTIAEVLPQIPQLHSLLDYLYIGGPVQPNSINMLVMLEKTMAEGNSIIDNVYLVNTLELLGQILEQNIETKSVRLYSGFAGWAPGQLETELMRGDWHIWHASADIIFSDKPETIWDEMIQIVKAKWVINRSVLY